MKSFIRRTATETAGFLGTPGLRLAASLGLYASVVYAGIALTDTGGSSFWTVFDDVGKTIAPLAAAAACAMTALRAAGRERRAWALVAAAILSWGLGQSVVTVDEVFRGFTPGTPSIADLGFLVAPLLIVDGILLFVETPSGRRSRIRGGIEALMIGSGLLLPVWAFLIDPFWERWDGTSSKLLTLAYPATDAFVLGAVVFVLTRRRTCSRGSIWLLAIGAVLFGASDASFWYLHVVERYAGIQPANVGWFVGFVLIGLSAFAGRKLQAAVPPHGGRLSYRGWAVIAAPQFVVLAGVAAVLGDRLVTGTGFSGPVAWLMLGSFAVAGAHGVTAAAEGTWLTNHLEDRVEERTAEIRRRERHFAALVEHSSDIVAVVGPNLRFLSISEAGREIYGWDPEVLEGCRLDQLGGRFDPIAELLLASEIQPGDARRIGWELVDENGRKRYADSTVTNLLSDPDVCAYVINTRDVTDETVLQQQLRHRAFHDDLSGLANRALFNDRAEHAIARSARIGKQVGIVMIDLDGFKDINDSLGHEAGDKLLQSISTRLASVSRAGDTVARLGGDEFVVLMEDIDDPAEASQAALRLRDALRDTVRIGDAEIAVTASVGVAVSTVAGESVSDLLRDADIAMYVAKNNGKDAERVFEPWMRDQARERFELLSDMNGALERSEFVLYYQPVYDLGSGGLEGFEALVRWNHPTRGLVPPDRFIRLAEETGLIVAIGRWVMREATRQLAEWDREFGRRSGLTMAINLSVRQLRDAGLVRDVHEAIHDSGVDPARIVLEITESMLISDPHEIAIVLGELKSTGARIAIDDFATGYSSLSVLKDLPVDLLKVDKSFVSPSEEHDEESGKLLAAILNLADTLGLRTVAEGIEDAEQASLLRDLGCDVGQGYLWSPALKAGDAEALVADLPESRARPGSRLGLHRLALRHGPGDGTDEP